MKRKYNFFFISTADWDNPFWTNKQHMAKILSEQGHRILYFESLGLRAPSGKSKSDKKRMMNRVLKFFKGPLRITDNLSIFSPIVIPKHNVPLIAKFNNFLLKCYISFFKMTYFRGEEVIFWTYNPLSFNFLQNEKIIYHCVDDLSAAPGMPLEKIKEEEKRLVKNSSITFVTSRPLRDKLLPLSPGSVHYFPNVADISHFSQAMTNLEIPSDMRAIKGPILGFVGAISSYKVDFNLLKFIAESMPEVSIVLIGQIGEGQPDTMIDTIQNVQNIHILGPRDYSKLPAYLKTFDVALLPCCVNDYTKSMFPMKFFEYLAAEKKVVATNLESLKEFADCCYIASRYDDFLAGVQKALSKPLNEFCHNEKLQEAVRENTWAQRTEKMLQVISTKL